MTRMLFLFVVAHAIGSAGLKGQTQNAPVVEYWEPGLESSYLGWREKHQKEKSNGFRVQLMSVNGSEARDQLRYARRQFLELYPAWPVYEKWEAPNWKLRVGDFPTAIDATLFRQEVKIHFPQAYVVVDEIRPWEEP